MKESYLYKKLDNKKVQCTTCAHNCVIESAKRGICGVRENVDGKLFALNYNKAIAVNIDPIEKKPLFHFLPGTQSLSIATVGCNLRCSNCQNHGISQGFKNVKKIPGQDLSPKDVVKLAVQNKMLIILI
jgi:pyruvate formate lyase activating enzyme